MAFLPPDVSQVRSQQRGLGWGTDYPNADINFSIRLSELTKTQVGMQGEREPNHLVVRPTDPELFQCPFVMASDPGSAGFSPEDAEGLRNYLLKGGFLWVDDFWGPWAWDAFTDEIAKALPRGEFPIKRDHRRASDLPHAVSDREDSAGAVDAVLADERRRDVRDGRVQHHRAHGRDHATSRAASWC